MPHALPCALTVVLAFGAISCGEDGRSGGGGGGGGGGNVEDTPRAERTRCTKIESVAVEAAGFAIFKYEAARPNATAEDSGCEFADTDDDGKEDDCADVGQPACSEGGLLPWTKVPKPEAAAGCERSGYRLCTEEEWLLACGGADHLTLPYGRVHHNGWCNDHKSGSGSLETSGTREECVSPYGAVDIVGNAWEWIGDPGDGGEGRYLGYSYKVSAIRPTADPACDAGLQTGQEQYDRLEVGFRCCRDL